MGMSKLAVAWALKLKLLLSVVVAVLVLIACLRWSWVNGLHPRMAPLRAPSMAPPASTADGAPGLPLAVRIA